MQQLMGGMGLGTSPHFLEMKYNRPCLKSSSVVDLKLGFKLVTTAHTHTHTQSPTACELVRQHVASGGVYDPGNGKWHGVSDVSYLCTTHTTPRHQLRPQFMKHFAMVHWDGYR